MPPMIVAFWRDFLVALALGLTFLVINRSFFRLERSHFRFMVGYGFTLAIFNSLWTVSVKINGAAIATVLIYSSAAFTALFERWFLRGRLGAWKIFTISMSLLGCILVAGAYDPAIWQLNLLGLLLGLLSGIGFTAYSLLGKDAAGRNINSWTALLYSFVIASFFLLIFNLFPNPSSEIMVVDRFLWLGDSILGWSVLILLAIGPSVGGYGLYTLSLRYLPASSANLIATLEPSMTALLAYLFLDERFTPIQIVGSVLILASVFILRLRERYLKRV
jgi:drug/metabolite transporter (DMT)-like permease